MGIPWVAHPVSPCDTCAVLKLDLNCSVDSSACHNITPPALTEFCVPGFLYNKVNLPSFNLSDVIMPTTMTWCLEQNGASSQMGVIPYSRCQNIYTITGNTFYHSSGGHRRCMIRQQSTTDSVQNSPFNCVKEDSWWMRLLGLHSSTIWNTVIMWYNCMA